MSELLRETPTAEIVRDINLMGGATNYIKVLKKKGKKVPSVATLTRWLKLQGYIVKTTYVLRSEAAPEAAEVQS